MTKCNKVVAVLCGGMIFASCVLAFPCVAAAGAEEFEIDFLKNHSDYEISDIVPMTDFNGNEFTLYRLSPAGYAIYDGDERFIEGSYKTNSPYDEYGEESYYYLGPTSYYVETEEGFLDIKEQTVYDASQVAGTEYTLGLAEDIDENGDIVVSASPAAVDGYSTTYGDFTVMNDYQFFTKMKDVPENDDNTCAIIAICILLAYLDTFKNDDFVADTYLNMVTKTFGTGEDLSKITHETYDKTITVKDSLKTLVNGVKSTLFGTDAMVAKNINSTIYDYVNAYTSFDETFLTYYGSIFFTHSETMSWISVGYPVLISMTKYTPASPTSASETKYHTVVAYGFDNSGDEDRFLVHMGYYKESEMILSSATIYSYFLLDYTGEHKHSYNYFAEQFVGSYGTRTLGYLCGCGAQFDENKNEVNWEDES